MYQQERAIVGLALKLYENNQDQQEENDDSDRREGAILPRSLTYSVQSSCCSAHARVRADYERSLSTRLSSDERGHVLAESLISLFE